MKNELVKLETPELQVIEKSKAEQIKTTFEPMVKMLSEFESDYNGIITESKTEITGELTSKAKRLRLDIGKVRIETGKLKDKQKEYIKLEDKAIMGVHNILVWAVKEKEDKLKEIENYFEIQEQKRLESLQSERVEMLSKFVEDAHERDLSSMDCDVWEAYYQSKKKEYEDRIAAEKKAEEERIERERLENLKQIRESELRDYWQFVPETHPSFEMLSDSEWNDFFEEMKIAKEKHEVEQKRIQKENERLQKEAEEAAKLVKIEAEKRAKQEAQRIAKEEAERKAREEKERKEREDYESKLKAEREEKERIEREERAKREELEIEIKAMQEAERKAKESKLQAELNKGDTDKVRDLITDLETLKTKYTFKSAKNQKMYADVCMLIDKVVTHIK